jgi:WD40 repeat protein
MACGSGSGSITIYETRFWKRLLSIDAHDDYVHDLAWTPDGTRLISASGDASVKIWDSVHPIARRFHAEDREARFEAARARLAELTVELGDPGRAALRLLAASAEPREARIAARRAALESWAE